MKHTVPAIIFSLFKLSSNIEQGLGGGAAAPMDDEVLVKVDQNKIFKSVNDLILALQESQPEMCMKLYL